MKIIRIIGILTRVIGFYLIFNALSLIIISAMAGFDIEKLSHLTSLPNADKMFLIGQGAGMLIGFIVLPYLYIRFYSISLFRIFDPPKASQVLQVIVLSIFIILAASPLIQALMGWSEDLISSSWIKEREEQARVATQLVAYQPTITGMLLAILVIGIIPAVGEELVFRGIMQSELKDEKWNMHVVIWFTAIVFSAIHMQFYGFMSRTLLGAMMGYLAWWSGGVSISMVFHCVNNVLTLVALNLYKFKNLGPDPEQTRFDWHIVLGSVVLTAVGVYLFRRIFPKPETPSASF